MWENLKYRVRTNRLGINQILRILDIYLAISTILHDFLNKVLVKILEIFTQNLRMHLIQIIYY